MTKPEDAIYQLRNHQQQLDQDGIMVGVSRQAIDEVLAFVDALQPEKPSTQPNGTLHYCVGTNQAKVSP